MNQEQAFHLLKMGKNIFLTGAAGSGKTYLLNKYIHYLKSHGVAVAVTATTGIAATHLQGTTIHSWSGMGVKDSLTEKDLAYLLANKRIKSNYRKTKVLIIDEISMLHKHQLDMVDTIARYIIGGDKPFGGMQVILCGDFFQLPPVSSAPSHQEKQFAFETTAWESGDFHVCYLSEQHRQGDDPLLGILNDIRNGTAGEQTKVPLRTRYKKEPHGATQATKLYSRNINVDVINENKLASIQGEEKIFWMQSAGFNALVEGLKKTCLAPEQLKLKIGAEVMFVKNDPTGKYVNGTRGVIIDFENSEEEWPIVKTYDKKIITVHSEEWKYEDNDIVRAVITQVPLRLAWAITIHKSQGMTLDAAEIDLGDAFEPGMGYVALSRVRSLNGLKLMNLNEMALKVHPKILQKDKSFKDNSAASLEYLQSLADDEIAQQIKTTLIERFGGSATTVAPETKPSKKKKKKAVLSHITTLELLKQNLSIEEIAKKREISVETVITHLEKLKGLNLIGAADLSNVTDTLSENDIDSILAAFEKSGDWKLKNLYEMFKEKYSYANLRLVRLLYSL